MDILKKINEIIIDNNHLVYVSIAKYISENLNEFLNSNIKMAAKLTNSSTASIVRFCHFLNLEGFKELKWELKKQILVNKNYKDNQNLLMINKEFYQKYDLTKKESSNYILGLLPEIIKLKKQINNSQNVYIFCYNVAYYASKGFVQRMRGLNYRLFLENDLSSVDWYLENLTKDDLVIFITLSGENSLILKYYEFVRKKTTSILITGKNTKPMNDLEQIILLPAKEANLWNIYSLRSQALQQFWDFLYYEFLTKNKP